MYDACARWGLRKGRSWLGWSGDWRPERLQSGRRKRAFMRSAGKPRPLRVERDERARGSAPLRGAKAAPRVAVPARRSWGIAALRLCVLLFLWGLIVGGGV